MNLLDLLVRFVDWLAGPSLRLHQPENVPQNAQNGAQDAPKPPEPTPIAPPTPPAPQFSMLDAFCEEIKSMEGWFPGSTSYTCNNPGNLRCSPGMQEYWNVLANGQRDGFCTFKDAATGMRALRNVTITQAQGKSPTYNNAAKHIGLASSADLNLYQYFIIRDPASDHNDPTALAERFGRALNVNPRTFTLKQLL